MVTLWDVGTRTASSVASWMAEEGKLVTAVDLMLASTPAHTFPHALVPCPRVWWLINRRGDGRIPLKDLIRFKERQWFVEELEVRRGGDT